MLLSQFEGLLLVRASLAANRSRIVLAVQSRVPVPQVYRWSEREGWESAA